MTTGRSRPLENCVFFGGGKMSDVRLSNGSPTLERTDARVSEHPKPTACRSLFGPVDHDELRKEFNGHLREFNEAASAKWGFDFANDKPLANGGFKWEILDPSKVPSFYTAPPRREKGVCSRNNNVDLNGNHSCVVMPPTSEDSSKSDGQTELRKRPACYEPSIQNKRSHTSPDDVSCPSLSHSVEHTPRKPSPKRQT